jgi:hypothetical protein
VNANPSGSRTPSTGSRGELEARREVATAAVLSLCHVHRAAGAGTFPRLCGEALGSSGGTCRAKMVRRGALSERHAAQGRVGDMKSPRHIASHLVRHLLLSACTSAPADAVRPDSPIEASPHSGTPVAGLTHASRRAAQHERGSLPPYEASDTKLVHPRYGVASTSACERSRRKGVLAA